MHLNFKYETNFRFGSLMFDVQPLIRKPWRKNKQKKQLNFFLSIFFHWLWFNPFFVFCISNTVYILKRILSQCEMWNCNESKQVRLLLSIDIPGIDITEDEIHKYFRFRLIKTLSRLIKWESNKWMSSWMCCHWISRQFCSFKGEKFKYFQVKSKVKWTKTV